MKEIVERICNQEIVDNLQGSDRIFYKIENAVRRLKYLCDIELTDHDPIMDFDKLREILDCLEIKLKAFDPESLDSDINTGGISGFLKMDKDHRLIVVKKGISEREARFVISHELGHLVMGHEIDYHDSYSNHPFMGYRKHQAAEIEANMFAGMLLIDKNLFTQDSATMTFDALESRYDLSYESIFRRYWTINLENSLHFLRVNQEGEVTSRVCRSTEKISWIKIAKLCKLWGARKVILDELNDEYCQRSKIINGEGGVEDFFCISKRLFNTEENVYHSVTLGCKFENAHEVFPMYAARLQDIESISVSDENHECSIKLCVG